LKSTAKKGAAAKIESDGASPSYHPRAAKRKTTAGSELINNDENSSTHLNLNSSTTARTPAKRPIEAVLEEEDEENGRRRSTRARTPAKAH
jgi:hypothetical protein